MIEKEVDGRDPVGVRASSTLWKGKGGECMKEPHEGEESVLARAG